MHPPAPPQDAQLREPTAPLADASRAADSGFEAEGPDTDEGKAAGPVPLLPALATVEQLLVEAAIQCPEAEALTGTFGSLSYADLLIRAQNIAMVLRQQGVGPGQCIGVAMDQSPVTITSIVGILLAGAAYVPLGRDLLQDSQALQSIRNSALTLILCDRSHGTGSCMRWSEFGTVLDASRMEQQTMPASTETRLPAVTPDSAAAVLFRRSTGTPSNESLVGVIIPHRAIARLVSSNLVRFHARETFLLHSASSARTSLLELWGSLLHGATLVLAPDRPVHAHNGLINDAAQLVASVRLYGVSTLCLPVSALHDLIDHDPKAFARLNHLVIEQDGNHGALSPQRLEWLVANHPRLRIVHSYGTLETSGYATGYTVPPQYTAQASVPIGEPVLGMQAVILDRELFPSREGEIGELAFTGDGVVSGYLKDMDATAQHFLRREDPGHGAGSHLYLTGERARRRSDGLLELHGRSARHAMMPQWLEPHGKRDFGIADIEAMLVGQQKVRDAAVLQQMDAEGAPQHVAFVALDSQFPETLESAEARTKLEASLRSALPAAAMPSSFHYVEAIPRDGQGSVDPVLLQQQYNQKRDLALLEESKQQETLDQVRSVWLRLLQRVSVGYDEDFFDAGGTQVQMIRMHVELNRRFPGAITMANLSVLRTIRRIYEHLIDLNVQSKMASRRA